MKVISKPKLKNVTCSYCRATLKIDYKDIGKTSSGNKYVECPICGNWNVRDDHELFKCYGEYNNGEKQ